MKASEEKEAEQGGARRSDRIGSKRVAQKDTSISRRENHSKKSEARSKEKS